MRADLVGLGVRLGWVGADDKEEPALAAVSERLRHEGDGILLIFDNAVDADSLAPHLPRGGAARVLVTSNYHAWRFAAEPARLLDTDRDAPAEYHDKLTVAKTFALAIDAASKLHPAAEPLIVHAALLGPAPIPLFLFAEGREKFGEPLSSLLAGDG